jgi:hypothetical protein
MLLALPTSTVLRRIQSIALLLAVVGSGCARIGRARPVPLYPNPERARLSEELAQVEGPIRAVDGVDVELKGTTFQLLPGCHVVMLSPKIGAGDGNGAWSADIGLVVYAFRMKPGRFYSIEPDARFGSAGHGTLKLVAYERKADGTSAGMVGVVRRPSDISACQAWAEEQGWEPASVVSDPSDQPPRVNTSSSHPK